MTVSERTLVTSMLISCLTFAASAIAQGPDASLPGTMRPVIRGRQAAVSSMKAEATVLPLESLSGDASQDYSAEGMTDELITNLGQGSALRMLCLPMRSYSGGMGRTRCHCPQDCFRGLKRLHVCLRWLSPFCT
jgi:hypothetical protein